MANMNFGVNILPKANNTYTLGNSDYKWNIFANTLNGVSLTNIITDIQIDGTSIVSNNVANIPLASQDNFGIIKLGKGLEIYNNAVVVGAAGSVKIKAGAEFNNPIVPARQHEATFYGLAKAAGDSTQSASSNAVGTYTDGAKTAIQNMLGVPSVDDIPTVPVQDIQVGGTSILNNGVANIPPAGSGVNGYCTIDNTYGINANSAGRLYIQKAASDSVKGGTGSYRPIVPYTQHESVFYGLAKAAGDSTQSASSNAVGTYTDTAKAAIQSMLGIQYDNQLSNTSTNPLQNRTINAALQKKVDLISDTFTANPVIFNSTIGDMSLKSIIINQKPIQSGSSDPSPTNIRPITGINKIILNHSGKNLLDPDDLVNKNYGGNNNLYNVRPEHLIPIVPGASMVLQGLAVNETNIRFYDAEGNYQSNYTISYYGIGIETFTVPSDSYYCLPKWYRSDTELTIKEVAAVSMLYYGTESSDFVPYNNSTSYTIILPALGKNLCSPVIKGVSIGGDTGAESTSATRATTNFIPVDFTANPNYRFSGLPNSLTMWVNAYDSNLGSLGRTSSDKRTAYTISADKFNQGTITGAGNIAYIRLTFSAGTNDDINDVDSAQIQLETGDTTTTYEPYDNTLYGGTFNLTTGTLTINRVSKTYTGASDENWNVQNTDTGINFYIMTPNTWKWNTSINDFLCNMAASTDSLINGTARITYTGNLNVCIGSLINISTVEAFKEWLSTHNLQIVTTLVQPYTISLPPLEVKVLKNINTFASNANGLIKIENYINFESFKDYIDDRTVQDVKINDTSIVSNNVATIPIATKTTPGVIMVGAGVTMAENKLWIVKATASHIKNGAEDYCPIVPASQHRATFYGLAKAAGDSTQAASDNAVGTYTADAKSAIQSMLGITSMTGATSSVAGTSGLVPAPATTDVDKFLAGDGTYKSGGLPMVILSYGSSTWNDFINAYNNNVIVYCRASSNSNPASGSQTRMAFMAYVNDASSPTNVEFQYYRSMSSHSSTAMGDEVYIYKLTNASGGTWSVTTRKASIKEIAVASGSKLGVSWSSDKVTLSNTMTADDMPMSSSDATTAKSAIDTINTKLGSTTMGTTATTITGAIAEHENDISTLNSNLSKIGTIYTDSGDTTIEANTWTSGRHIDCPAGKYIVRYTARNNNGTIRIGASTSTGDWTLSPGPYSLGEHITIISTAVPVTFTSYMYCETAGTYSNSVTAIRIA